MKFVSLYKALGSKKVAVAVLGSAAAYKIKVSGHEGDQNVEPGHSQSALQDWLSNTSERAQVFNTAVLAALHSARLAWKQGTNTHPTATGFAEFLATLATERTSSATAKQRPLGLGAAGSSLIDWLLDIAVDSEPSSLEVVAVERYLLSVLTDPEATTALLSHPGSPAKILTLSARLPLLSKALDAALSPYTTVERGLQLARAAPTDIEFVLAKVRQRNQPPSQRLIMLKLLQWWSDSSVLNCTNLGRAGIGGVVVDLAAASSDSDAGLRYTIARIMDRLVKDCPPSLHQQLRLGAWPYQLLCFTADAAGNDDRQLVDMSLNALASASAKVAMSNDLVRKSAIPLLWRLARMADHPVSHKQDKKEKFSTTDIEIADRHADLKAAIAKVVRSLADDDKNGGQLLEEERGAWTETLLKWLINSSNYSTHEIDISHVESKRDVEEERTLRQCVISALWTLSSPVGPPGMHVAHAWLAELVIQLSGRVQPYEAVKPSVPTNPWFFQRWSRTGHAPTRDSPGMEQRQQTDETWSAWVKSWLTIPHILLTSGEISQPRHQQETDTQKQLSVQEEIDQVILAEEDTVSATQQVVDGETASSTSSHNGWLGWWSRNKDNDNISGAPKGAVSDPELAMLINAAAVGPVYARAVAAELMEASGRVGNDNEPPPYAEDALSAAALTSYPRVAAVIDFELADQALTQALKVLCALGTGGEERRAWLLSCGILPLLRRLALDHGRDYNKTTALVDHSAHNEYNDHNYVQHTTEGKPSGEWEEDAPQEEYQQYPQFTDPLPLGIRRQASRVLALLTMEQEGAAAVYKEGWVRWLQNAATSTDCKVSSSAAKALLNIESAACCSRLSAPCKHDSKPSLPCPPESLLPVRKESSVLADGLPAAHKVLTQALTKVKKTIEELEEKTAELLPSPLYTSTVPLTQQQRLVLDDGVYLIDPLAPHHAALARAAIALDSSSNETVLPTSDAGTAIEPNKSAAVKGPVSSTIDDIIASTSRYQPPKMDIVFIHGIRGGAFATWRREGSLARGQARDSLEKELCWPSSWLAPELPNARLLSVEYAAPASGWEGESLPFSHTVAQISNRLVAAGVGDRPVIFICHSMGGLLVKEMLARGMKPSGLPSQKKIAHAATGVVFYSVPHFGAKLADWGWNLRYIGGSPAKHVEHLRTGPHLEELNAVIRGMVKSGKLGVLSFGEGKPTPLSYVRAQIVPHESAYPGYGDFVVLQEHDHISVCKPGDKEDPAYSHLLTFLKNKAEEVRVA